MKLFLNESQSIKLIRLVVCFSNFAKLCWFLLSGFGVPGKKETEFEHFPESSQN